MKRALLITLMFLGCQPPITTMSEALITPAVLFMTPDTARVGRHARLQTAVLGTDLSIITARDIVFSNCEEAVDVHVISVAVRNSSGLVVELQVPSTTKPKSCETLYVLGLPLTHALTLVP